MKEENIMLLIAKSKTMNKKDITLTIDGKIHKLMDGDITPCDDCSLHNSCSSMSGLCPAIALGGDYFVELKVEK